MVEESRVSRIGACEDGNGEWMEPLRQYTKEKDQRRQRHKADPPPAWPPDQQQHYRTVQNRVVEGGTSRAKSALESGPRVANDDHTLQGLRKLVAVEVDEQERCRLQSAVRMARRITRENAQVNRKTFRRRVETAAVNGKSWTEWLHTYIQMMAHIVEKPNQQTQRSERGI